MKIVIVTDIANCKMHLNADRFIGMSMPSPLSVNEKCQILMDGPSLISIAVSHVEAERFLERLKEL